MTLIFDHSYARDLPGTYLRERPDPAPAPRLLALNEALARDLGLDPGDLGRHAAEWFSGAALPPGAEPIALAYAGHQFGGFSAQLGDGRAHLLGEMLTPKGRFDLQLKGSGRTAFSRGGDGKAAVGPMLREYLISEAMAALGVPTTRALAVVATGEEIWRDTGKLPGAVLARVAASHIRVGTFQFFAARGEVDQLRRLTAYTIARHYPDLAADDALGLFDAVADRQIRLIAQWMGLGFLHGVMNTDNMALSGETIDYGPCAFMEAYAPGTVFSSIDRQGRYAYANQPLILGWNLARLAEALLPLIDADQTRAVDLANAQLESIAPAYRVAWLSVMRAKLGLAGADPQDGALADDFLAAIAGADWTLSFRALAAAAEGRDADLLSLVADPGPLTAWLARWQSRLAPDAPAALRRANPAVIPRNHLVEAALSAATEGDLAPFEALLDAVRAPFDPEAGREAFTRPAPKDFGPYVTFCGT
ncbi:YdiU family protein [bacterium]|nr:YdiU family protein [bacterium]